jgi:hypothetical protein
MFAFRLFYVCAYVYFMFMLMFVFRLFYVCAYVYFMFMLMFVFVYFMFMLMFVFVYFMFMLMFAFRHPSKHLKLLIGNSFNMVRALEQQILLAK